jgi:hypothetical protein
LPAAANPLVLDTPVPDIQQFAGIEESRDLTQDLAQNSAAGSRGTSDIEYLYFFCFIVIHNQIRLKAVKTAENLFSREYRFLMLLATEFQINIYR